MHGECRITTRNTEYRFQGAVCVEVRDLQSGSLLTRHGALGQTLSGCVRLSGDQAQSVRELPRAGLCLWFQGRERDVLTTPVLAVAR